MSSTVAAYSRIPADIESRTPPAIIADELVIDYEEGNGSAHFLPSMHC